MIFRAVSTGRFGCEAVAVRVTRDASYHRLAQAPARRVAPATTTNNQSGLLVVVTRLFAVVTSWGYWPSPCTHGGEPPASPRSPHRNPRRPRSPARSPARRGWSRRGSGPRTAGPAGLAAPTCGPSLPYLNQTKYQTKPNSVLLFLQIFCMQPGCC